MSNFQSRWTTIAAQATLGFLCLLLQPDALPASARTLSLRMSQLPHRTLWVWERPEDLRDIDPGTTAIAWLDQTILLGQEAVSVPRRQPIAYPTGVARIAVVRIEALRGAKLDAAERKQVVGMLLQSATQPGIVALQVDFDATRSQRAFYASLLADLRQQMPVSLPLSITALASWCSYDDWIGSLPVDEAVPMLFRMEPDRRRVPADSPWLRIREPLCAGSIGISTHEAWPDEIAGKRIYVFADRGWRQDISLLTNRKLP